MGDVSALGPVEGLAVVEGLKGGQDVLVLLHEIGELAKEAGALDTSCIESPGSLESLVGGLVGDVDILGSALDDASSRFAVGGVNHTVEA